MAQVPLAQGHDSVKITIRLVDRVADSVDELAAALDSTRSVIVREAVEAYLEQHQEVLAS